MSLADVLTPMLSRLQARYEQTRLPGFFGWWFGELRGLLPARLRERLAVKEVELWLRLDGDVVQLARTLGEASVELARLPLTPADDLHARFLQAIPEDFAGLRRVLLLPQQHVLRRRLSLPAVARDKLQSMLVFELDRQTPFRADQVYFDARVLPHPSNARQVPVELALVQRQAVAQVLTSLGPLSREIDAIDVADDASRLGCNFMPEERRRERDARGTWISLGLIAGSVLFLVLAMGAMVDNRRAAVEQLQAEVDRQRTAARGVTQLRTALDEAVQAANFLAVEKTTQPSMLELLHQLTEALPDDTFLERLSIAGENLNMTGQSNQAAQLIERLQQLPTLRNPALAGAIQPDPRTGKDRFTITAQVGPAGVSP
jgi:general secretion pathway protein L